MRSEKKQNYGDGQMIRDCQGAWGDARDEEAGQKKTFRAVKLLCMIL